MAFNKKHFYPLNEGQLVTTSFWNNFVNSVEKLDEEKINKTGGVIDGPLTIHGNVSIDTQSSKAPFHISGGQCEVNRTDGDFKIGDDKHCLKIGVDKYGDHAGDVRIRAWGGTHKLMFGGGDNDILFVSDNVVDIWTKNKDARLNVHGEIRGKLWYSEEYIWEQGWKPTKMKHSSKCVAFLTFVQGAFMGGGEKVYVKIGNDGYWYLEGTSMQREVKAGARCIGTP